MTDRRDFFTLLAGAAARTACCSVWGVSESGTDSARFHRESSDVAGVLLAWHQEIIVETQDLVCCYKPNIAFFEVLGAAGMALRV